MRQLILFLSFWHFLASSSATFAEDAFVFLPRGKIFAPLVADPKQTMFRGSIWWVDSDLDETLVATVGLGESFGLGRWHLGGDRNLLQIDISGGIFAQFDLLGETSDLINSDFIGALPITYRQEDLAVRLRIYHQSSHLGDEYLLNNSPTLINFSYEAVELMIDHSWDSWRPYGGFEYLYRRDPESLEPWLLHFGLEYRSADPLFTFATSGGSDLLLALDTKFWQEDDFQPAISFKAGLEFGYLNDPFGESRKVRFLIELFHGISPYGQFFTQDIELLAVGFGMQLAL